MHDVHRMLPIHSMRRVIFSLLLLLGLAGFGCATDYAEGYQRSHPGWTPSPPLAGDSLEKTLASLQTGREGSFAVSVQELRVLRVGVEPWETVSVDAALAGTNAQMIALIAPLRCKGRRGIHFFGTERVSWYIFAAGELVSFDDFEFGEACEPRNHYLPSPAEHLATELALVRYAASRYPESAPSTEEMLGKGMALVSAGRLGEAKKMLRRADRKIDFMSTEADILPQDEREALQAEEKRLRAMRAKLSRAIAVAQEPKAGD